VWFAAALSVHRVALVVEGTSRVAIAGFTSIWPIGESVVFRPAPVAVSSLDEPFTSALAGNLVASAVVDCAESVAPASFASVGVVNSPVPESSLASVASFASNVSLADTSAGDEVIGRIRLRLAFPVVLTANPVAIACLTDRRITDRPTRVLIVTRATKFAVGSHRVVSAIVTNTATDVVRLDED